MPIGTAGHKCTLFLLSDGAKLYAACDVPDDSTEQGFGQFRWFTHLTTCPQIICERIILSRMGCHTARQTTVRWTGEPPANDNERWKKVPIYDYGIYRELAGAMRLTGHRQYELSMDLAECGFCRGVPFCVCAEVEGDAERNAEGKFLRRTIMGELGTKAKPVWFTVR